jgi:hypothetical protein
MVFPSAARVRLGVSSRPSCCVLAGPKRWYHREHEVTDELVSGQVYAQELLMMPASHSIALHRCPRVYVRSGTLCRYITPGPQNGLEWLGDRALGKWNRTAMSSARKMASKQKKSVMGIENFLHCAHHDYAPPTCIDARLK